MLGNDLPKRDGDGDYVTTQDIPCAVCGVAIHSRSDMAIYPPLATEALVPHCRDCTLRQAEPFHLLMEKQKKPNAPKWLLDLTTWYNGRYMSLFEAMILAEDDLL